MTIVNNKLHYLTLSNSGAIILPNNKNINPIYAKISKMTKKYDKRYYFKYKMQLFNDYIENDEPQPHVVVALGLSTIKREPSSPSV